MAPLSRSKICQALIALSAASKLYFRLDAALSKRVIAQQATLLIVIVFIVIGRILEAIGLTGQHRFTERQCALSLDSGLVLPGSSATVPLGFGSFLLGNRHGS